MRNLWIQNEQPIATWNATLEAAASRPETVLSAMRTIYDAGQRLELLLYKGGSIVAETERRWRDERVLDMFLESRRRGASATVFYYSSGDELVSKTVEDLGALLEMLQSPSSPVPRHHRELGEVPVQVTGADFSYDGPEAPQRWPFPPEFSLVLHSDIWFPYVLGQAHPACDYQRYFDNGELFEKNGTRLNELIGVIKDTVEALGGLWELDRFAVSRPYRPWLSASGIARAALSPPLHAANAMNEPWPSDDDSSF